MTKNVTKRAEVLSVREGTGLNSPYREADLCIQS